MVSAFEASFIEMREGARRDSLRKLLQYPLEQRDNSWQRKVSDTCGYFNMHVVACCNLQRDPDNYAWFRKEVFPLIRQARSALVEVGSQYADAMRGRLKFIAEMLTGMPPITPSRLTKDELDRLEREEGIPARSVLSKLPEYVRNALLE